MITGDNALTGISVARKCGLVKSGVTVFLGDIDEDNPDVIKWQDIDSQLKLNKKTLKTDLYTQRAMEDFENFRQTVNEQSEANSPTNLVVNVIAHDEFSDDDEYTK